MPGFELFDHEERNAINDLFDANGGVLFAHGFDGIRNGVFKVREFEKTAIKMFDVKYAQAVSSCTAALRVALAALELGPDDEVIIPSFTFVATAEAVLESGAKLVVVDIDDSFTMCPISFKAAITSKTAVVIPVHMMSAPADLDQICKIAKENNIVVIEDAAWGVGASWKGKALGTIGDMGCYSFDAGKCISTGEGGMILTNNEILFKKARAYHDHGHEYSSDVNRGEEGAIGIGFNFRMTELQGAIGIVQLGKLDKIISTQRQNKKLLKTILTDGGFPFKFRKINDEGEGGDALFFILNDREQTIKFLNKMKALGISTKNVPDAMRWHFAKHWSHMFSKSELYKDSFQTQWQKSADILECSIAIPIMIKMTGEQIHKLGENLLKISKEVI